mmetsp:Transcript_23474/g.69743  ORF Transcript_23474/g.69743 Transcript_23474/m.69743 type:complete len:235 (+) Transcript_23474:939-1643(+)
MCHKGRSLEGRPLGGLRCGAAGPAGAAAAAGRSSGDQPRDMASCCASGASSGVLISMPCSHFCMPDGGGGGSLALRRSAARFAAPGRAMPRFRGPVTAAKAGPLCHIGACRMAAGTPASHACSGPAKGAKAEPPCSGCEARRSWVNSASHACSELAARQCSSCHGRGQATPCCLPSRRWPCARKLEGSCMRGSPRSCPWGRSVSGRKPCSIPPRAAAAQLPSNAKRRSASVPVA